MDLIIDNYGEISYQDLITPKVKSKRRSSIFNVPITVESNEDNSNWKKYQKSLENEISEWNKLVVQKNHENKLHYSQKIVLDKSILSPDQLDYANKRIDIEKFVAEHKDFSKKAFIYKMKKEHILKNHKFAVNLFQDIINKKTDQLFTLAFNETISQMQN